MADASVHTPQPDPFGRPTSYCYRCLMTWPCEVSGLLARIEQLEQENAALSARLDQLQAALREYAHHRPWCAARPRGGVSWEPLPEMGACGCGLSEVVRC